MSESTLERIRAIVCEQLDVTPEQVKPEAAFAEDLGADSLDLVELMMATTDEGLRLQGIRCYELAKRWALTTLEQDDHKVLSRIVGPGRLGKEQKVVVQRFLREQFMRSVWEKAQGVLDYLGNTDYHSPGVE